MVVTCTTDVANKCSSDLNKLARKKVIIEKFGDDLREYNSSPDVSCFVHYVVRKLNTFENNELTNELIDVILKNCYKTVDWGFNFKEKKKLILGMINNYLKFKYEHLKKISGLISEHCFHTWLGDDYINIMPDYVDNNCLIDFKNQKSRSYNYRQIIFYMLCFNKFEYGYVNLLQGTYMYFHNHDIKELIETMHKELMCKYNLKYPYNSAKMFYTNTKI